MKSKPTIIIKDRESGIKYFRTGTAEPFGWERHTWSNRFAYKHNLSYDKPFICIFWSLVCRILFWHLWNRFMEIFIRRTK